MSTLVPSVRVQSSACVYDVECELWRDTYPEEKNMPFVVRINCFGGVSLVFDIYRIR